MSEVPNVGPSSSQERKLYQLDYKQGAELFQQALDAHEHANSPFKKAAFQGVMERAMNVMNESARALKEKSLLAQNKTIANDFASYQNGGKPDPLKRDLEQAKRSV